MDIRLVIARLRPGAAYGWLGIDDGKDGYEAVGEWRDARAKPTEQECLAEWEVVLQERAAEAAAAEEQRLIETIALNRKIELNLIPNWATWTPGEAESQVTGMVLSGQSKEQVNSWIDANVTGATAAAILASVKVALKLLAGAIIDLRTVAAIEAKCIMYLRDIVKP